MTEERDTTNDLQKFAKKLVSRMKWRYQLKWGRHRTEDATQDLLLAGWQVLRDENDVGLAKHRMKDRAKNLLRDYATEMKHEPKAASEQPNPAYGHWDEEWDEDVVQRFDAPDRTTLRGDPSKDAFVKEYLDRLTDRQRQIYRMRMAGYSTQETADELGIGLRTVERELEHLRKDYPNDDTE